MEQSLICCKQHKTPFNFTALKLQILYIYSFIYLLIHPAGSAIPGHDGNPIQGHSAAAGHAGLDGGCAHGQVRGECSKEKKEGKKENRLKDVCVFVCACAIVITKIYIFLFSCSGKTLAFLIPAIELLVKLSFMPRNGAL